MSKSLFLAAIMIAVLLGSAACRTSPRPSNITVSGGVVQIAAAENFWGSLAAQAGGSHAAVTSIINDPNADPHNYEPVSSDARTIADAQYVIFNGAGYDPWMNKLLAANPSQGRKELNAGDFFGKKAGDNPHMWYNPDYVRSMVGKMRDDLKTIDPADSGAIEQSADQFLNTGLSQYTGLIADIKSKYAGTPVGATESIFAYMAPALGLNLITPSSYMNAVSEGTDVSAADEAAVEQQIAQKQIKILVYNSQNTPPNIRILLDKARAGGIPTAALSETLIPAGATFQDWQTRELQAIEDALVQASAK